MIIDDHMMQLAIRLTHSSQKMSFKLGLDGIIGKPSCLYLIREIRKGEKGLSNNGPINLIGGKNN